jgi:integrase
MKDLIDNNYNRGISNDIMGKAFNVWDQDLQRLAPNTQQSYRLGVGRFLEYLEADYEELYEAKLSDMRSGDPRDFRRIEKLVSQFMHKQVREDGLAPTTARRAGVAVTHFMRSQGLTFVLNRNEWPRGEYIGQRMVQKHQIRTMVENASAWFRSRNRALITLAKDSGLRISDIEQLDVDHFLDARSVSADGEVFKEFKPLVTKKTKAIAYVCIGPEAVEAIELYLNERGATRGEPLFLDQQGNRFKVTAMSELLRRSSNTLEDGDRISAHSLRKYNETMMESAGIPLNWIKRYQGRKVSDSTGPYSNPQDIPDKLIQTYIQGYDSLRLYTETREFEAVKQELSQYKAESDIQRLSNSGKVTELEAQIEQLSAALTKVMEKIEANES